MLRVLVIDHKISTHNKIKALLNPVRSISVVSVASGYQALDILEKDQNFDVILLSWELTKLTGAQTFKRIKHRNIPIPTVVMATSHSTLDEEMMFNMGITEYLIGQYNSKALLEKLSWVSEVPIMI